MVRGLLHTPHFHDAVVFFSLKRRNVPRSKHCTHIYTKVATREDMKYFRSSTKGDLLNHTMICQACPWGSPSS